MPAYIAGYLVYRNLVGLFSGEQPARALLSFTISLYIIGLVEVFRCFFNAAMICEFRMHGTNLLVVTIDGWSLEHCRKKHSSQF